MTAPGTPRLLEAALYVADLERSVRFYQSIFGMEVIAASERLTALALPGKQVLLIFKKGATPDTDGDGRLHVAFAVTPEELQAWEAWFAQNSIGIEKRITWERGGHSIYFRDPDGHLLELGTPGIWTVY